MPFKIHIWGRKLHRWGALLIAVPFLLVIVTGLLLQLKKDLPWVQPPAVKRDGREPTVSFDEILAAVQAQPEAEVTGWQDIDRVDLRPKDGIIKVTSKNRYEVQVDFQSGEVLQVAYRRSDLIESIHDGSFFHDAAKLYVFLPTAFIVLGLWITGMYLWVLPNWVRWRRHRGHKSSSPRPQVVKPTSET